MYSASTVQPVSYQNSLSVSPVADATHTICTRTALAAAAVDRLGILVCSLNVTTPKPDRAKLQILTTRRSLGQATQNVVSQYSTACISSELAISIGFVAL